MIKFTRATIWLVTIIMVALGLGLRSAAMSQAAFEYGSSMALQINGAIILTVAIVAMEINIVWGMTRWTERCVEEKWKPGRIVGKIIGGGIWRGLVMAPIFMIALLFIAPTVVNTINKQVVAETSDFVARKTPVDILEELEENLDSLDFETIKEMLAEATFSNIEFSDDASGNVAAENSWFFSNAYASGGNVKVLNKVVKSKGGRFLVFYTDTGDNKISSSAAEEIGEMMETLTTAFKDEFNLNYHTEQIDFHSGFFNSKRSAMEKVLESNGIDKNLLNTAMPIYVVNPYTTDSNVLASYVGHRWADTYERVIASLGSVLGDKEIKDVLDLYGSSPVLPFINILPENINDGSLELVVAHEFGHHYASNYCYDTFGKKCGSDNDFVDETLPNYMASKVVKNQPKDNLLAKSHLSYYIAHPDTAVYNSPYYNGYAPFSFLENYAETVDGGQTKIMNALMEDDAYWYLYKQAGRGKMAATLKSLAIKNITDDYGTRYALYANKLPKGESLPCMDFCSVKYDTREKPFDSSSIHYFYFPLEDFKNRTLEIWDYSEMEEYGFIFLGLKDGKWDTVSMTRKNNLSYLIDFNNYTDYEIIALAVTDYGSDDNKHPGFSLAIATSEVEIEVEEKEEFFGEDGNCFWFYTDGMITAIQDIVSAFSGLDDDLDVAIGEFKAETDEVKNEIGRRKVTICGQYLNYAADFETVQASLGQGLKFGIFNYAEPGVRVNVTLNADPLKNTVRAYLLTKDTEEFTLITATVE